MSEKHSVKNRKWWSSVSMRRKSKIMSDRAKLGWSKQTKKRKLEVGRLLAEARKNKKNEVKQMD